MKKHHASSILLLAFLLGLSASPTWAQYWDTYESEAFDVQFDLPADWVTEVDEETLISTGDDIVFVLAAVKEASISTEELFYAQVENLGFESEGEFEEIELRGGILAILGAGAAVIEGEVMGLILVAATLDENNYLAYIATSPEAYEKNEDVMVDIITSLAPLGWVDE